jgi:glycine cleavage system H protein
MDEKSLKFAETHEWVYVEGDIATIGISKHAQEELGDVVYVETKDIGEYIGQFEELGSIESVKAVSEVNSPVSGEITEKNSSLDSEPELINKDPYGKGWIVKIKLANKNDLNNLMDFDNYQEYLESH